MSSETLRFSRVYVRLTEHLFKCTKVDVDYSITKALIDKIVDFPDIYIEEIAMIANTTPASVTKYCKKIGYQSFKELRTDLETYGSEVILESISKKQEPDEMIDTFLEMDQIQQKEMFRQFDRQQCQRIAELLAGKKKVAVLGSTSMFSSVNLLRELLSSNGVSVYEINRRASLDILEDILNTVDVIFLISITGEWLLKNVEHSELFRRLGQKKIIITRADLKEEAGSFDEIVSLRMFDYLLLSNYYSQRVIQSWILLQMMFIE